MIRVLTPKGQWENYPDSHDFYVEYGSLIICDESKKTDRRAWLIAVYGPGFWVSCHRPTSPTPDFDRYPQYGYPTKPD